MSPLEARIAKIDGNRLATKVEGSDVDFDRASTPAAREAEVERYALDLAKAVGVLEAAELMVAAAFILLGRAEGGKTARSFARRCYWSAIQAFD
jgi:hypothetical protein